MELKDKRTQYFIVNYNIFDLGLDKHSLLIYICLCKYASGNKAAYPSFKTISEDIGVSTSTITKYLPELIEKGLITKQERKNKSNLYTILDVPSDGTTPSRGIPHTAGRTPTDGNELSKSISLSNNNKTYSRKFPENTKEYKLAKRLADKVKANNDYARTPKSDSQWDSWCVEIDRLHRLDNAKYHHIEQVIDFACWDDFWKNNIMSTSKLRKQFAKLFPKAKACGFIKEQQIDENLEFDVVENK